MGGNNYKEKCILARELQGNLEAKVYYVAKKARHTARGY
jgi:hypothetical protein